MLRMGRLGCLAAALLTASVATPDVWDVGNDHDNGTGSDNEIVHGLDQVHDLAARNGGTVEDVDFYAFRHGNGRSYEILVDGITGAAAGPGGLTVQLVGMDGTTVDQDSVAVSSFGVARSLRSYSSLPPSTGTGDFGFLIRVSNPACALTCGANDEYRIRAYDTTLTLPRFNNTNGQTTVLLLQNPTHRQVLASVRAMSAGGVDLGEFGIAIAPYGMSVTSLGAVSGGLLANQSGSLFISHNAGYGILAGKGVALELTTGFTFDTAVESIPH